MQRSGWIQQMTDNNRQLKVLKVFQLKVFLASELFSNNLKLSLLGVKVV